MPRIAYIDQRFSTKSRATIAQADEILQQYARQGLTMTLRQVYYQFVARGLIPNRQTEYKRLGQILNDARLAGLLDWYHMEDRTRSLRGYSYWDQPSDIIDSAARGYKLDHWRDQDNYVEVWIEKDALTGVIQQPCFDYDVPYFSCRGYTSQSELWIAAQRLIRQTTAGNRGRQATVLHFGDHDPSGIDMTRDIEDRLNLFCLTHGAPSPHVERLALNEDQVRQYDPPPNPTKLTDSRATGYIARFGYESWELDALEPTVIGELIRRNVAPLINRDKWDAVDEREERERDLLLTVARRWDDVVAFVEEDQDA